MNINQGMWAGNVVTTPEFKLVGEGQTGRCKFRFAQTDRRRDAAGVWQDCDPLYITVTCWRALAEHVVQSVARGDGIVIVGKMTYHEWEKDGQRRSDHEIDATTVGIDLSRHVAAIKRTKRSFADADVAGEVTPFTVDAAEAAQIDDDDLDELVADIPVAV